MKVLKIVLIVLAVIIGGFSIWMATLDGKYDVNRTVFIDSTPEAVYAEISDFKTWPTWGAWFEKDSTMQITYGEISQGAGATYSWTSEYSGSGTMEILEAESNKSMKTKLDFDAMGSSNGYWNLTPKDGGTEVTWGFTGEMPFFLRFMNSGMDAAIGADFVIGLNNLKAILEARKPVVEIAEVALEAHKIYYMHYAIGWEEISSELYAKSYGAIGEYLGEDMAKMTWAPLALIHVWDEVSQTAEMDICIPSASEKPAKDLILVGETYAGKALKAIHMGDYSETGNVHFALEDYMTANQLEMNGPAFEVFVTDPVEEPDTAKWVTEIYYPIK